MGEVYRAKDTKLGREVAIKVLPESVSADPERLARFEREARALASLNHPNIVTIYSVEEAGDMRLLAMELVEGQTLDLAISTGGLSLSRFFEIAVPLADALSAAHERGIVHRDLKPANVMLTREGRLKVLDFGLAKLVAVDSDPDGTDTATVSRADLTGEGTVFGTVAYMSPEQARGGKVDARSDVFSLGVVLYEMLTGDRPFKGASSVDIISSILRDWPSPVTELRTDLPPHVGRILRRCLAKDPHDRYQTSRDVFNELRDLQAETSAPSALAATPKQGASGQVRADEGLRVAVLPFKSSGDAEMESFADGLGEEITTGLSRFRYLSVVASASAARVKGESGDERALGAKLGARYVLEGSIRKGGSAIRVSAQLVDAETGARLWAETYNRDLQASSIFAEQDDIAARIVATVADSYGVLVHSMRSAMRQKDDAHLTPVEWQFQYFAYREQITPSAYAELKSRLESAVERDGRQSDLWACLAQIFVDEYAFGFGTDPAALDRALAAARRAVEMDRANQFALVALAQTHFFRQDLAAFGPAAERAIALNPLNTDAVGILGLQIVHTGEFERGAAIVRRAMELNANHAGWMHFAPLWEHFHKEEYEQALERANRVDVPGLFWPYLVVASACGHLGRRAQAAAAVRDLLALDPEFAAHARSNVGTWHFASGLMEPILEGLRKAGLSIPAAGGSSDSPGRSGTITARTDRAEPGTDSGQVRADEGFWVAVLPFNYSGADAGLTAVAEGLTEDIVTGLSRFSYLRVIARSSTSHLVNQAVDVRSAGKELGARYVMEGSLRQAGTKVRLAVQLVDTTSGSHLWAEVYDRAFNPEAAFELQDDLVPRIVSTCADRFGVLARSISDAVRGREPGQLGPYEALLRGFGYHQRLTPAEHAEAREALERAVERAPSNADCWAMLSWIYSHEYAHGFNVRPGSLDRALAAARRAVDIAPSSQLAQQALAVVLFFRKETAGCLSAAERAMALNPLDTSNEAMFLITFTGDWDRGCVLIRRAMELNPHHPRWYGIVLGINEYRLANYRAVVDEVVKANAPEVFWTNMLLAAAYGQLGELTAARNALRDLLAQKEDFARSGGELLGKWFDPQMVGTLIEGLRKAGLDTALEKSAGTPARESSDVSASVSGAVRTDEGFWVAVLPFKYSGANAELASLAEGLTAEIVTGLSRFSYLRVIARSSTSRHANESVDVRSAGKELGARYVMEGSLRQAGTRLRLAVQLVDASSGAHLWAENFERAFSAESLFELQDDLVPRIVSTVADMAGVLPRSMSEDLRSRPPEQLSPYEAVLRSFAYFERYNPEELTAARSGLEAAVRKAPAYADAWAMLSILCAQDYVHGYDLQADALEAAASAARRAVELGPSNHLSYFSLAQSLSYQKDFDSFRDAAERAVELNPMDGNSVALLGELLTYAGSAERGMQLAERAKRLNPNHPGWYWYADFYHAFSQGDYRGALGCALKVKLRGNPLAPMFIAAASGQLGESDQGSKAVGDLLKFRPELPALMRKQVAKIWNPQYGGRFLDGLRKAGLEIPDIGDAANRTPTALSGSRAAVVADSGERRAEEGFWVAILPFKYGGADPSLAALTEGLTEEIVTGLSRFSYLRVIARSSTSRYAKESVDVRAAGKELGARYVMEGSVRQAGTRLRLAVQLVDASSGAHLWAENFERTFSPETVFELQDDLVPRIVSTVADMYGVLVRSMSEALRGKADEELSPHEAVLRAFGYMERVTPEEHARVRGILERAVSIAPNQSDAWAMLANLYWEEHAHGLNPQPDPLERALAAARRAVEAAPSNSLAHYALASTLFFLKDFLAFRPAAERAIELNRMDASVAAYIGNLIAYSGDWERGCAVVESAMQLNPHHPGWYWFVKFNDAYRRRDYRGALGFTLKINLPGNFYTHAVIAQTYGQLGMREEARKALQELLALRPDFAKTAREEYGRWFHDLAFIEHQLDGLRKAGLEIAPAEESAVSPAPGDIPGSEAKTESGAGRGEEGFWVAVLPFKSSGPGHELTALAEGLTEDVVTGLSRFSYLRVIARSSTAHLANQAVDVRAAGKELGARYVMEGSLRESGTKLRLSVQLVDATSGAHLWAENYERSFSPQTVFELQDDLAPRIVSTVADMNGVLPRSMSEAVRSRDPERLTPYEAVLRSFGYLQRVTPEDLAAARSGLELAVKKAPAYADAWAMLAFLCGQEYGQGFKLQADPLTGGATAARRAVEADPSNALAYFSLAQTLFFQKDFQSFRNAAERAVALNPMDGNSMAFLGELLTYAGDEERGLALAGRAKQLNPNHPGWYWYADFFNAYRHGDYRGALGFVLKANLPGHWGMHAAVAVAQGQLGERAAAAKALRDLLKLRPDFAAEVRTEFEKWWEPAFVESLLDGLRKAGLEIAGEKPTTPLEPDAARSSTAGSGAVRADGGFWVAVLPFKYTGANPDLTALAEGLTEDIVTGLSRFTYLRVIARSSTSRYANESIDVRSAGKELGARYVMEGSLRQAGTKLRLAVQLVDAASGAHLWAENYERGFRPDAAFELVDDLVPRIVSTVADPHGVLPHTMSEGLRNKPPEEFSPYEAVLRSFGYGYRITPEEHAVVRASLERAVESDPGYSDAWAMLSLVYGEEYSQGFNLEPDSLGRALHAAQRAADAAPSNALAFNALARAYFFRKEFPAFRTAAERAIELNPLNGPTLAGLGSMMAYAGDWEHGCALVERATQRNPRHPGWYWMALFMNAYRKGDYRGAVSIGLKVNLPEFSGTHEAMAAAYGQLGERDAARGAVRELLRLKPDYLTRPREKLQKFVSPELVEHMMDGLRKAGLDVPALSGADPVSAPPDPVAIAVLPFSDMSPAKDQEYLCEGMAEEIMNALVRIDGIRVASRTSAFRARQGGGDLASIARALSVNHVLEGSVRTAGGRLRVTAQLTDVASGYQLWSERFDRDAADVFAVQDDIAAGVVEAVKARLAPGSRTVQHRAQVHDLEGYRSFLKGRHLRGVEDYGGALRAFEEAVRLDPAHAPSWTGLAEITVLSAHMGMIPPRAACTAARKALATAKELQGESAEGLHVEAFAAFLERRWDAMETAWRRALDLQPDHVLALGSFAISLCARQRLDEALPLFERAREADPLASFPYMLAGWGLLVSGRPEEGLRHIEDALTFEKEDASAIAASCMANVALGRLERAIAAGEHGVAVSHRAPFFLGVLGWALATAGRKDEARKIFEEMRARPADSPTAVSEAWLLGALGEIDDAFDVLARAEEEHQGLLSYTGLPGFDPLRTDPRFGALLERLGLSSPIAT